MLAINMMSLLGTMAKNPKAKQGMKKMKGDDDKKKKIASR